MPRFAVTVTQAGAAELAQQFGRVGKHTATARRELRQYGQEAQGLRGMLGAGGLGALLAPVGLGLGIGALTTRFAGFARSTVAGWDQVAKAAARAQMPTADFQRFSVAAELAGTSMSAVSVAIKTMQTAIALPTARVRELGINLDAVRRLRPEDQFRGIAAQIAAITDPAQRAAAAVAMFGRSGTELLPLLTNLKELEARAPVISENVLRMAEKWADFQTLAAAHTKAYLADSVELAQTLIDLTSGAGMGATEARWAGESQEARRRELRQRVESRPEVAAARVKAAAAAERAAAEAARKQAERERETAWRERLAREIQLAEFAGDAVGRAWWEEASKWTAANLLNLGMGNQEAGLAAVKARYDSAGAAVLAADRERLQAAENASRAEQDAAARRQALAERYLQATGQHHRLRLLQIAAEAAAFRGSEEEKTALAKVHAAERAQVMAAAQQEVQARVAADLDAFFEPLDAAATRVNRDLDRQRQALVTAREQLAAREPRLRERGLTAGLAAREDREAARAARRREREDQRLMARAEAAEAVQARGGRATAQGRAALEWRAVRRLQEQAGREQQPLAKTEALLGKIDKTLARIFGGA